MQYQYSAMIGNKIKSFKTLEEAKIWATKELEKVIRAYLAKILTLRAELEGNVK